MARGRKTGGRVKGKPNKLTADVRTSMALFAEATMPLFEQWVTRVAAKDPGKAADLYLKAIEYHIPKLARTEVTGSGGAPLSVVIQRFTDADHTPP
jgi:hypothetical protein